MNTLKYALILRQAAEKLFYSPDKSWWFAEILPEEQIFNWVNRQAGGITSNALDHLSNEDVVLCFLFLACALEAGDLE